MSQIQVLCILAPSASSSHLSSIPDDAATRARLFWYAYTQEGLTAGLRGGRFNLHRDDYESFQRTIPLPAYHGGLPSPPSPSSSTAPSSLPISHPESQAYNRLLSSSAIPLQINTVCRKIHSVLTGPKAVRQVEERNLIDAHGMREIWRDLDQCWRELSTIRRNAVNNEDAASRCDTERYACAWQIFIFECHNVIRESLKQYMTAAAQAQYPSSRPSSHSSGSPYLPPDHLHLVATRKCLGLLPRVIRLMQFTLTAGYPDRSGIFTWDSGLVRDGCFYAGYLAASTEEAILDPSRDVQTSERDDRDLSSSPLTADEGVMVCLAVLSTKRWLFSKSDEREETIRMIWESRKAKRHGQTARYGDMPYDAAYPPNPHPNARVHDVYQSPNQTILSATSHYLDRPNLPALSVFTYQRRSESASNNACTTDGHGTQGWPSYTPPPTGNSLASNGTGLGSIHGSPEFGNVLPTFKGQGDEAFYHGGGDLDHFAYNVPVPSSHPSTIPAAMSAFSQRDSPTAVEGHTLTNSQESNYAMTSGAQFVSPGSILHVPSNDYGTFGDNSSAAYH